MATYNQKHGWREDGWGQIEFVFRISNSFDGLFLDDSECSETNIFLLDEISKDVSTRAGGIAEHEMSLETDEAAMQSSFDEAAMALMKTARTPTNIVYCAAFLDTGSTPLVSDMLFSGIILPDQEGTDKKWFGTYYDQNPTPIRSWRIKSRPFSSAVLDKFTLHELIDGTTDGPSEGVLYIDPISTSWESSYVFEGQGWFSKTWEGIDKTTHVNKMVAMNRILRQLADQLEAGLLSKFNITLNINFERTLMEGLWHPTRWNKFSFYQMIPRWVGMEYNSDTNLINKIAPYTIYAADKYQMAIDPDNASYALGGEPTQYEQLYISYRLIKEQVNSPAEWDDEPDLSGSKDLMWEKRCTSFLDLIYRLALSLGCFAFVEMTDASNLNIKIVRRQSFVTTQLYLKTARSASLRGSNVPLDEGVQNKWAGKANQFAADGCDIFYKNLMATKEFAGPIKWSLIATRPSENLKKIKGDEVIVTIAPTVCEIENINRDDYIYFLSDNDFSWVSCRLPFNHYTADDGTPNTAYWQNTYGIHSALYMFVDKWGAHPDPNSVEAASYYTPVGAISVKKDVLDLENRTFFRYDTYYSMSEYLNELLGFDTEYFNIDYTLEIPFYYGLSTNADGSAPDWRNLQLGSQLVLDGVTFVVEGIKYKLSESKITLKLSGVAKYDFDTPVIASVPDISIPPQFTFPVANIAICKAANTIEAGFYVYDAGSGTCDVMAEENACFGKGIGIALNGGNANDYILVQTSGIVYLKDAIFTAGSNVFIHTSVSHAYNYSHTALSAKSGALDMHCLIGQALSTNELELLKKPKEYILT